MKKFKSNVLILSLALILLLTTVAFAQADLINAIDWSKGGEARIVVEGRGRSGGNGPSMARLAAITDAQRHLLGVIKGVEIDSDTLMSDLIIQSDTVKTKVSGLLRGAQILEEHPLANDEYSVKMYIPVYGSKNSLASVIYPEIIESAEPEPFAPVDTSSMTSTEVQSTTNNEYTGVVINADGLGMEPTFSPVIYDTDGRAIYGVENLDRDKVIEEGMVNYVENISEAVPNGRAGNNPLVINAVAVRDGKNSSNKVNAVISVKDGNKILLANESNKFLKKTSVIFVR